MRILIVSDSLIQFLIATHLRSTVFADAEADLMMYDSMPNAIEIYENIKKSGIYTNCYMITSVLAKGYKKLTKFEVVEKMMRYVEMITFPKRGTKRILTLDNAHYDAFVFCSNGIFLDGIYNVCKKENKEIKCYRYEGGLASYLYEYENCKGKTRARFEKVVKKFFHNYDITDNILECYYFEPQLVQFNTYYPFVRLEKITNMDKRVIDILNQIFKYNEEKNYVKERYIAFEDGNLYFQNSNEEIWIFSKIAEIVGEKEFLVRMHPRMEKNRFEELGITAKQSLAPWEVILMNQKMKDKIFFTCLSGSVITSLLYFDVNVKVVLLYKCIKDKPPMVSPILDKYLEDLICKLGNFKISIPKDIRELEEIISKNNSESVKLI